VVPNRFPELSRTTARRGLGSNLYRLGVRDILIQQILRHANVSTTATYYLKTTEVDEVIGIARTGGEGGIRTLDTGVSPYNGLAIVSTEATLTIPITYSRIQ